MGCPQFQGGATSSLTLGGRCWNLLPRMLSGVRGTEYYLQHLESIDGEARFSAEFSDLANYAVREGLGQS